MKIGLSQLGVALGRLQHYCKFGCFGTKTLLVELLVLHHVSVLENEAIRFIISSKCSLYFYIIW